MHGFEIPFSPGFSGVLERGVLHGVAQGGLSVAQGGKFGPAFLSASFSAIASHSIGVGGTKKTAGPSFAQHVGRGATAAIVGGTASVIGGGKFANGAATGAFVYAFNHAAEGPHNHDPREEQSLRQGRRSFDRDGFELVGRVEFSDHSTAQITTLGQAGDQYRIDAMAGGMFNGEVVSPIGNAGVKIGYWHNGGDRISGISPTPLANRGINIIHTPNKLSVFYTVPPLPQHRVLLNFNFYPSPTTNSGGVSVQLWRRR